MALEAAEFDKKFLAKMQAEGLVQQEGTAAEPAKEPTIRMICGVPVKV